jgi:hypothetical protein
MEIRIVTIRLLSVGIVLAIAIGMIPSLNIADLSVSQVIDLLQTQVGIMKAWHAIILGLITASFMH